MVTSAQAEVAQAVLWDFDLLGLEESPKGAEFSVAVREAPWPEAKLQEQLKSYNVTPLSLRFFPIEEEDWLALWKEGWEPTAVGERLLVVPAWLDPPNTKRNCVRIEPGMAFGTGTHPTTQLAYEVLEDLLVSHPRVGWMADVGIGTGVLSLGAAMLAPGLKIFGTDYDAQALRSCNKNLKLNPGAGDRIHLTRTLSLPCLAGAIPLIVANVTAGEHEVLDAAIEHALSRKHATLILSGFMSGQEKVALERWQHRGLKLQSRKERDSWIALHLQA